MTSPCNFCGGAAHPSTGCVYGSNTIACWRCTEAFWAEFSQFVKGKGLRRGIAFYDHVNVISPILREYNVQNNAEHGKVVT